MKVIAFLSLSIFIASLSHANSEGGGLVTNYQYFSQVNFTDTPSNLLLLDSEFLLDMLSNGSPALRRKILESYDLDIESAVVDTLDAEFTVEDFLKTKELTAKASLLKDHGFLSKEVSERIHFSKAFVEELRKIRTENLAE